MIARTYCGCFNMAMNIKAEIKNFLSKRKRMKYLSLVIHSNLVNGATEASTATRMAKELAKYVEKWGMRA